MFCDIRLQHIWANRTSKLPPRLEACELNLQPTVSVFGQRVNRSMRRNLSRQLRLRSQGGMCWAEHSLLLGAVWKTPNQVRVQARHVDRLRARRTTCAAVEFGIPVDGKDIAPITATVPCMETPLLHVSVIPLHDRRQQILS